MSLHDPKIVFITGASRGIGAACARHFAARGVRVGLLARSSEAITALAEELGGAAATCDVADPQSVSDAISGLVDQLGPADVLVNNAGVVANHPVAEHPTEAWRQVMAVNLDGPFYASRAVLPAMIAQGAGRIVNVASISATLGTPGLSAYCASKWGLVGFTKALSEEVKGKGVVVTALNPGSVDTDMLRASGLDFPPQMTPEEVAASVWFLATGPAAIAGAALDMFG
ncbi:MAG: SDR family oxidoreductase [Bradymonadia bacterium]